MSPCFRPRTNSPLTEMPFSLEYSAFLREFSEESMTQRYRQSLEDIRWIHRDGGYTSVRCESNKNGEHRIRRQSIATVLLQ